MNENPAPLEEFIDRYKLVKLIGKGGMGEVFLAYDPSCERQIALKRIRPDLMRHPQIKERFLSEAHITCQLTHPAIIPIYTIQDCPTSAYYTMPYVEGDTLKQIIRKAAFQEKQGDKLDHVGGSIPALMRIFLSICQAVAYAHSKRVIHRDLKLENVIVGKYGEVLILDWGLAKSLDAPFDDETTTVTQQIVLPQGAHITRAGKIMGTVSYMAPERAFGASATFQTDIYSLGVMLYQLLTLRLPFKKESLEAFKKHPARRTWVDPILVAPYRDIPKILSRSIDRCLAINPKERYQSVDLLIRDLEIYTEGRSEWFSIAQLNIDSKHDWEFQENVLIAEHVAITRLTEEAEWVSLMISRRSFAGNIKIETELVLGETSHGIGFLVSAPEAAERSFVTEGYCLWIGSDLKPCTKLLRLNVEVINTSDIFLKRQQSYQIRIEKIDNSIYFFIDNALQFTYSAHIPLTGTHIGLLSRDANFNIGPLHVYVGSLNITINCLAVPDAFFAHGDYPKALSEYRRIAYSFADRPEGREALFRAGLTFLEQAKNDPSQKSTLLESGLQEFEKLHKTPGGPLEYLGKALTYQILGDEEEEVKCFELAYRRYPKHPLLPILQEEIVSRMHEVSRQQRASAYRFILLAVSHLPPKAIVTHTVRLFGNLQKYWEPLPFLDYPTLVKEYSDLAIPLAFWLAKPYLLGEIIDAHLQKSQPSLEAVGNAFFALIYLGAWTYALHYFRKYETQLQNDSTFFNYWSALFASNLLNGYEQLLQYPLKKETLRFYLFMMDQFIEEHQFELVKTTWKNREELSPEDKLLIDYRRITTLLLEKKYEEAEEIFSTYPLDLINRDTTFLHFLYGCWLVSTESKEIATIHFQGLLTSPYPRSWTLASHYLTDTLPERWLERAFLWEKKELYTQLSLYYFCAGEMGLSRHFQDLSKTQGIYAEA